MLISSPADPNFLIKYEIVLLLSYNRDYWWNPNCANVPSESSAVLMFYGEVYKGPINMRVKQVFFRGIPSSNEYAVDQGTVLLIDYDQCVKSMDTSEAHSS